MQISYAKNNANVMNNDKIGNMFVNIGINCTD